MNSEVQDYVRKLESRFRNIISHTVDALVVIDTEGVVQFVNPAAETLFGRPAGTLVGELFGFPIVVDTTAELNIVRQDGAWVVADMRVVETMWDGAPAYLASLRDMTHNRRIEQLEHDRNQVLELITQNEPLEVVLAQMTHLVENQCLGLRCSVLVQKGEYLVCVAGYCHSTEPGNPDPEQWSVCYTAATTMKPVVVYDNASEPCCIACSCRLTDEGRMRSCYAFPLLSREGDVYGVLVIHSQECCELTEEAMYLVDAASYLSFLAIEQHALMQQLVHQAHHDALTGLPNRVLAEEQLHQSIARSQRQGVRMGVFFIDLDRFKQVNDTLGHPIGDALLKEVALRLRGCVRADDVLARMGGDEFLLVANGLNSPAMVGAIAGKLLEALTTPFMVQGHELFIGASIGVSFFPDDGHEVATLLSNADVAMYRAKGEGGHKFCCFAPEMSARAMERMELETSLRRAFGGDELVIYYQSRVDQHRKLVGMEAMVRWKHPRLGWVDPTTFWTLAEESGLVIQIGTWLLQQTGQQVAAWRQAGYPPLHASVKMSDKQFAQSDLIAVVGKILDESGIAFPFLELELDERTLIRDYAESAEKLSQLQGLGVRVAIDRFGTGYSSLSCLQRLPINIIKIDRSLLQYIGKAENERYNDTVILSAIMSLGHNLGIRVVADGVDSEEQFLFLQTIGCHGMQGGLFGPPLTADSFEKLLLRSIRGLNTHFYCIPELYYDTMVGPDT